MQVVLDQTVEQEPPRLPGGRIRVPVGAAGESAVDHPEFGDAVRQLFLTDGTGLQVEPPPMQPRLHPVERQKPEGALPLVAWPLSAGSGLPWKNPASKMSSPHSYEFTKCSI